MTPRGSSTSSARHEIHRQLRYTDVPALRPRLLFGQSNTAELRIDEDHVWHEAASGRGVSALDQIRAQDAVVVVGDVRESGAAVDVT
jgi:hypothetical protein